MSSFSSIRLTSFWPILPFVTLALVLGILIPNISFRIVIWFTIIFLVMMLLTVCGIVFDKQKIDFFSPMVVFPIAYWFFYGLGLINLDNTWGLFVPQQILQYYIFGFLFFLIGLYLANIGLRHWKKQKTHEVGHVYNQKRFWFFLFSLLVIGAFGVLLTLRYRGTNLVGDLARLSAKVSIPVYLPYLSALVEVAGVILAVNLFINWDRHSNKNFRNIVLIAITLGMTVILLGSRHFVIPIGIGLVLSYHYFRRRIRFHHLILIFLLGIMALSLWYGYRRTIESTWDQYVHNVVEAKGVSAQWAWIASPYLQARDAATLLVKLLNLFPESYTYWHGRATLSPALTFLPGKQWLTDDWITVNIRHANLNAYGGTPPTIIGGFYMDGGWLAVAIGMLFTGFITQLFYLDFLARPNLISLVYYSMILSFVCVSVYGYINLSTLLVWKLIVIFILDLYAKRSIATLPSTT